MNIRPATDEDRPAVARLIGAMGSHEEVLDADPPMLSLRGVLANPYARGLVAEDSGVVVGYGEIQSRPSTLHDTTEAWLGGLAVAPDRQGQGIGQALLAAATREAAMLGCSEVVLESSSWRSQAHRFYERAGFSNVGPAERFRRPVDLPAVADSVPARFLMAAARAATAAHFALDRAAVGEGKAADRVVESAVIARLAELELPVLSAESGLVGRSPQPGAMWIALDPIDGTRNFLAGLPPYAIVLGLVRDEAAIAGFVMDLASGRRWWGGAGMGAWCDGRPARPRATTLCAVPSPRPGEPLAVPGSGFERVRVSGCTSVDLCGVASGSLAAFNCSDSGEVYVQDAAGPLAILAAAGAVVVDERGGAVRLRPDPKGRLRFEAKAADGRD